MGCSLAPLQFGCGISGGCEVAGKLAGFMHGLSPKHVLIKTDLKNAFNTIARSEIHRGLTQYFPGLLPWFEWAYGAPSPLVNRLGEQIGSSQTGVRQGDPLAALLFCVAVHPAIEEMNTMIREVAGPSEALENVVWIASYMDDISIAVPAKYATQVCEGLVRICDKYHLTLNINKCRVIGRAMEHFLADNPAELPPPFPLRPNGDTVLGNPVGEYAYCQGECAAMADRASSTLRALEALLLPARTVVQLIRFCINPRVQYLTRVHEVADLSDILRSFDVAIDRTLWRAAKHDPTLATQHDSRGAVSSLLRSLPLHLGGMGIMRHSWVAGHIGKASARLLTVQFLDAHVSPNEPWMPLLRESFTNLDIMRGCPLLLHLTPEDDAMIVDYRNVYSDAIDKPNDIDSTTLKAHRNHILHFYSHALTKFLHSNFSTAQAVWYKSSCFEGSGRWLGAPSASLQHPSLVLSDREFDAALRMRLLLQNSVSNDAFTLPPVCRCHPETALDPNETLHMLDELPPNRTAYHARHNACRDLLLRVFKRLPGFMLAEPEPKLPGQDDVPEDQAKRPDLVVEWNGLRNLNPRRVFIDVAVSNPAARTFRTSHIGHPDNPQWTFFGAAISRENQKRDKYAGWNLGESFVPFAIDATGRLGPQAMRFVVDAFHINDITPVYKNMATYLQARLGIVCMKVNAQIVNQNAHALFMHGRVGGNAGG